MLQTAEAQSPARERFVLVEDPTSGVIAQARVTESVRRGWLLEWANASRELADQVDAHWQANRNAEFYFLPREPDFGQEVVVRYAAPPRRVRRTANQHIVAVEIERPLVSDT